MTGTAPGLPRFGLTVTQGPPQTVLAVSGELDLATAAEFAAGVREQLASGPLTLDLRALSFMDSSGIRALDGLLRDAESEGRSLLIDGDLQESVRKVLELTGMLATLPLVDGLTAPEGR
ncbi:MAG TPA: STAS domain-containing protein [Solirubrobacteraceae bacterium]|jgi:anti-sigma B factor antagonist|nr:STAS domain-containing protein [Solirubrobacteraceae bacterium]